MPDTKTSVRWEQFDQPALRRRFKAAGVSARVVNAQGDPQKQKTQADQCIADGAKVLIIAPIDSGSAAAIEKAARAKGVKSIDYDRQVEGGSAVLYASFDGHTVGVLQGKGVVAGLKPNGHVQEASGRRRAVGRPGGRELVPVQGRGTTRSSTRSTRRAPSRRVPQQFVPGWDNQKAGTIFEQMLVKTGNKIDAVAAANDGIANAVVVGAEGAQAEADPAQRPGRHRAGRAEHHLGLADDDGVQGRAGSSRRAAATAAIDDRQGQEGADDGQGQDEGPLDGARVPDLAAVDHEGELQAPLHLGFPEEERRLQRRLQAVLQVGDQPTRRRRPSGAPPSVLLWYETRGMSDTPLLRAPRISKAFGSVQALTDVDFEVRAGEVMALVGDNGAGKSTLIKCIAGIHPMDEGEMIFDGQRRQHPQPEGRSAARDRGRLPGSRALRQPRRRAEHVPRPRDARPLPAARRSADGGEDDRRRSRACAVTTIKSIRQAGRDALRRAAPVGRGRARGDVELAARHPRRADGRARRRADRAGARARHTGSPSRASGS